MNPSENESPHTLCPKCNNFILTPNFLIHEARCKGDNRQSNTYRMSNIRRESSSSDNQQEQIQRIPCPYCGYGQTLKQLDTHPNVCPHREVQCQLCHLKFPLSLMDQHQFVCSVSNGDRQQNQRNRNQENRVPNVQNYQQRQTNNNRNRFQDSSSFVQPRQQQQQNRMYDEDDEDEQYENMFGMTRDRRRQNQPMNLVQMMMRGFPTFRPTQNMRDPFAMNGFNREQRVIVIDPSNLIAFLAGRARPTGQAGLTQQQIKRFPVTKYKNHENVNKQEDEDMCAICFCNFHEGENCLNLPCKHNFHPQCVGKWLQKNPTCPLCKKNFQPEQERGEEGEEMQGNYRANRNMGNMGNIIFFNRMNLP